MGQMEEIVSMNIHLNFDWRSMTEEKPSALNVVFSYYQLTQNSKLTIYN